MFRMWGLFILAFFLRIAQCGNHTDPLPINPIAVTTMDNDTLKNRKPAVAGTFYPANQKELELNLERLFSTGTPSLKLDNIVAIITPHAGYVYSGSVAASGFNQLPPEAGYKNVFIIGSSHHSNFDGAALYSDGNFITPLGVARVNLPLTKKLIEDNPREFYSLPEVHINEHSLEVQVPFLQYIYKDNIQIVPIVIATNRTGTIKKIAEALSPYFNSENLFVISTDFSHYPEYEAANMIDGLTAKAIIRNNPGDFLEVLETNEDKDIKNLATSICGWTSVLMLLYITEHMENVKYYQINYMNSGDMAYGNKSRVVGYHAIAITNSKNGVVSADMESGSQFSLTEQEKKTLLRIARVTIETYLKNGKTPEPESSQLTDNMKIPAGAFVTLNKHGNLRGCIGQFQSDKPLYTTIQELAISSATRDYRFPKVTQDELTALDIEISILTPLRRIYSIDEIELGRHGIYIKKDGKSGTFLPQVATQTGWDLENFLGHCARDKAGIGWNGWKDAELYTYEAYIFAEN